MPEIRAEFVDQLSAKIDAAMPAIARRAAQAIEAAGLRMVGRVQRYMRTEGIYDTGELRKSIHAKADVDGSRIQSKVASNMAYAEYVHEGRGPGKPPPVSVLTEWVLRRNRQGRLPLDLPRTKKRKSKQAQLQAAARGVAFAIQKSIARKGIEGKPFFDEVFDQFGTAESQKVGRQLATIIREEVGRG